MPEDGRPGLDEGNKLVGIEGIPGSGKSAIINALDMITNARSWPEEDLFENKLTGDRAKSGYVSIEFSDGRKVVWARENKEQSIELFWEPGHKPEYEKFTTIKQMGDVLGEFTGFKLLNLDKDEDAKGKSVKGENIQLVPLEETTPFLLSRISPETTLRRINRLGGGAGFESALTLIKQDIKAKTVEKELLDLQLQTSEKVVEILKDERWEKACDLYEKSKTLYEESDDAYEEAKELEELNAVLEHSLALLEINERFEKGVAWYEKAQALVAEANDCRTLAEELEDLSDSLELFRTALRSVKKQEKLVDEQIAELEEMLKITPCEDCDCWRYDLKVG